MSAAQRDRDISAAHEARLTQLYITRAKLGDDAPPHVHTEIAEIEDQLDQLRPKAQSIDLMTAYRLTWTELMRLDTANGQLRRELADLRKHIDKRFDRLMVVLAQSRESPPPPTKQTPKPRRVNGE